jgi:hypothetical protein
MLGGAAALVSRPGLAAKGTGTPREQTLPTENVRCRAYAQRAADQYRLSTRTSKCRVPSDERWHLRVRDHYQWCLSAVPGALDSEEKARDEHLYRCGGQYRID